MNNEVNDELEIDIFELFKELLSHWKFILIIFALMIALSVSVTAYLIPKKYEARISMYVNNGAKDSVGYINSGDINASRSLVSTYMELIKSDCVLEKVLDKIGAEGLSLNSLNKMIVCQQIKNTEIFEIRVKSIDPELSAEIAKQIGIIAPKEISRVFKAGSVEIVDNAKVPTHHISPSIKKNAVLGGLLGIIISCGIVILSSLLNQKVKNPKDYEAKYNIPLLGVIPDRAEK